jgi:peptidoglycan/LPS O-acetylase OafA/YrhL
MPAVSLALILLVAAQVVAGPLPLPFGFWGQPIVLEFAAGMVLALLRRGGLRCPDILRWPMAASGLAILLLDRHVPVPDGPWRNLACHGGAAVLLVLAAASGRGKSEPSAPIRALARLGDASYALYLVHPFAIRGLRELFLWVAPGWPLLYMLCALVASVLAALLVHRFFECPATELLRQWLRSRAG